MNIRVSTVTAVAAGLVLLGACATPDATRDIYDPLEPTNRAIHGANKALDRSVLRPAAYTYRAVPKDVRQVGSNFAANLAVPGTVVNDLLQFHLGDAIHNTLRFAMNSTLGLGGLFDPASGAGLDARPSDFGETLYVWGVGEGAYVELPLLGPSNARDATGQMVDLFFNPIGNILPANAQWTRNAAFVAQTLNDRANYGDLVDSVLYESEDSYAQSRLFYLENRRFSLGQDAQAEEDQYDIYDQAFQ